MLLIQSCTVLYRECCTVATVAQPSQKFFYSAKAVDAKAVNSFRTVTSLGSGNLHHNGRRTSNCHWVTWRQLLEAVADVITARHWIVIPKQEKMRT